MFSLFPGRFTLISGHYGLFSLKEMWSTTLFDNSTLANAQSLMDSDKILGFKKHANVQGKKFYLNINNALPSFKIIETFSNVSDPTNSLMRPYCTVEAPPTCMYIA